VACVGGAYKWLLPPAGTLFWNLFGGVCTYERLEIRPSLRLWLFYAFRESFAFSGFILKQNYRAQREVIGNLTGSWSVNEGSNPFVVIFFKEVLFILKSAPKKKE
jgi:hypothetical protein